MAITKVAKVLKGSTGSLSNDTLILEKENGNHKGLRLSYKSNNDVVRLLSPLEEFEKYYKHIDPVGAAASQSKININVLPGYSSIVIINNYSQNPDILSVILPQVDTTLFSKNIYYTYKVRIVVDANVKGFTIKKNPNGNSTIYDKDSIIISKQYTSFDVFLGPDNKWRIHGVFENYSDSADSLFLSY